MFEIPLFPLNTVLFPGVPLTLHIFEPRYKQLVAYCLDHESPFGVVLIRKGHEALGPLADPYRIGVSAQIIKVDRLDDGRMNIAAVGLERFRLHGLDRETQTFLMGEAELYPMKALGSRNHKKGQLMRRWMLAYLDAMSGHGGAKIEKAYLPAKPEVLAYLGAYMLQVPVRDKQDLLSLPSMSMFAIQLIRIFQRELALLPVLMSPPIADNKINLN